MSRALLLFGLGCLLVACGDNDGNSEKDAGTETAPDQGPVAELGATDTRADSSADLSADIAADLPASGSFWEVLCGIASTT